MDSSKYGSLKYLHNFSSQSSDLNISGNTIAIWAEL